MAAEAMSGSIIDKQQEAVEASLQAYLCASAAAFCWGIQYVPVKRYPIYDGVVFQWFMCSGILFTGLLLGGAFSGGLPSTVVEGMAGGSFWGFANAAVLPLVKLLGLGLGFALYHAVNLSTGYVVGRFGFFGVEVDAGRTPWLRDLGALLLGASFVILMFVEPAEDEAAESERHAVPLSPRSGATRSAIEMGGDFPVTTAGGEEGEPNRGASSSVAKRSKLAKARARAAKLASARTDRGYSEVRAELVGRRADPGGVECVGEDLEARVCADGGSDERPPRPEDDSGDWAPGEPGERQNDEPSATPSSAKGAESEEPRLSSAGAALPEEIPQTGPPRSRRLLKKALGGLLALISGFLTGMNALPFDRWRFTHPMKAKGSFVFPQALGIWTASTVILLTCSTGRQLLRKPPLKLPCIGPAFFSGCIWSMGFVFMCLAIDGLGFTAAYAFDAIGPVFVASTLSVVVFREITEYSQLRCFGFSCFVQAAGVTLIAVGT